MDLDLEHLSASISATSTDAAVIRLRELISSWQSDDSTVEDLERDVEWYISKERFPSDSIYSRVYDLWSEFRDKAIRQIAGMTMNERLSWFSLFCRFDEASTPAERAVIYRKLLAKA